MRADLSERLRDQLVSALHLGRVRPGDRLPSIRQVAAELGANPRAVARAYRRLEAEHLVEVRDRSGIYAAAQTHLGGGLPRETARWAARVVVDGWRRRIGVSALPAFFARCTAQRVVRCAFVEDSEDAVVAFVHDLREELGLAAEGVWLRELPAGPGEEPPAAVAGADLLVTTAFHAHSVAPLAAALGKPLIVLSVNPDLVEAVGRRLRQGVLTVICVDLAFARRLALQFADAAGEPAPLRVVLAGDRAAVSALPRREAVLLTRAARAQLGRSSLPLVFPHSPTLSAHSAMELVEELIRLNLGDG